MAAADEGSVKDLKVFAADVQKLIQILHAGKKHEFVAAEEIRSKFARELELAKTIFYLRDLVWSQRSFFSEEERLLNHGAQELLEAIAFGTAHPVWDHIKGLQKGQVGQRKPPTNQKLKRAVILAYVLVLKDEERDEPVFEVVAALASAGVRVSSGMIASWQSRTKDDDILRSMIEDMSQFIARYAEERRLDREIVARMWAIQMWAQFPHQDPHRT